MDETAPLIAAARQPSGAPSHRGDGQSSLLLGAVPAFARAPGGKLALLSCACAMEASCYSLCVPFMTTHLNTFHAISVSDAGLIFVAYTVGSVCSTPFVESAAERLGCSGAICAGVLALGLSQMVFACANSPLVFFAVRFVGGLAAGLVWSAVLTSCHRMSIRTGRGAKAGAQPGAGGGSMGSLFGTVLSAVSIGTMLGPALGGLLYRLGGWPLPFGAAAAACVAFAAAVALLLPEEGRAKSASGSLAGGGARVGPTRGGDESALPSPQAGARASSTLSGCAAIASPQLLSVLTIVLCGGTVFSSVDSVLPIHLHTTHGYTALQTALVFFVISVRAEGGRARPPRPPRRAANAPHPSAPASHAARRSSTAWPRPRSARSPTGPAARSR